MLSEHQGRREVHPPLRRPARRVLRPLRRPPRKAQSIRRTRRRSREATRRATRVAFEDQRHIRRVNDTTAMRGYKSFVNTLRGRAPVLLRAPFKTLSDRWRRELRVYGCQQLLADLGPSLIYPGASNGGFERRS